MKAKYRILKSLIILFALSLTLPFWGYNAIESKKMPIIYDGELLLTNGNIQNSELEYPLLIIDHNIYFPLTWDLSRAIGIQTDYSPNTGLNISTGHEPEPLNKRALGQKADLKQISIATHKIKVNSKIIASHLPIYIIDSITYVCLDKTSDFEINSTDILFKGLISRPESKIPSKHSTFNILNAQDFVRNQGSTQECWAYAANSMLEIKIALTEGKIINLSENDLIQNCPIKSSSTSGGNWQGSSAYLIDGKGPVKITETSEVRGINAIKKAIMKNGSVLGSIYYGPHRGLYYNKRDNSYFYNGNESASHELILIGWDDNFSKDKFTLKNNSKPRNDGAFLAMNSFGEDFGDGGMFYISYEDALITRSNQTIDAYEFTKSNETTLKLDVAGVTHYETLKGINQIYATVKLNLPKHTKNNPQRIKSIGVFTAAPDTIINAYYSKEMPYEVSQLRNIGRYYSNHKGYAVIDLNQKIIADESFYIILKYDSQKALSIPIESVYPGINYAINYNPSVSSLAYKFRNKLWHTPLEKIKDNSSIVFRLFLEYDD